MAESLEVFCGGSTFWDEKIVWNTTNPDFPECFQKTVLVWIPCGFLWVLSPIETHLLLKSKNRNIPWTGLNITKLVIGIMLILLTFVEMCRNVHLYASGRDIPSVDFYSPFIKFVTFLLATIFIFLERRRGLQTTGVLFLFWFLLALAGLIAYRTYLENTFTENVIEAEFNFILQMIYFPLVIAQLVLACLSDAPPRFKDLDLGENACPEQYSSFLARMIFSWFDGMALKGYRKPLDRADLWSLQYSDQSKSIVNNFDKYWKEELRKSKQTADTSRATYNGTHVEMDFHTRPRYQPSILKALIKSFGPSFAFAALLKFFNDLLTFVSPMVLQKLIEFVSDDQPVWRGYFYAAIIFAASFFQSIILGQYFKRIFLVGMRLRSAVISAVYRKAMRLSNSAKRSSTVGEIVNLMSVDAQRFMDLTTYLNLVWSAPLQISLAMYFLWQTLGPSVLTGVVVMILLIPINGVIANKIKKLQVAQMKNKDQRVKLMNEILNGIKVLKLYAWELSFSDQVQAIRDNELEVLKKSAYLNAFSAFLWMCAPFLIMFSTFMTYVLIDENNILDATKAFVSLSLFNILRMPMTVLPMMIVGLVQVTLATFATFVLEGHQLDASRAFTSIALFNILRFPINMLPLLLMGMIQVAVSTFSTYVLIDVHNILDPPKAFVSLSLFQILRFPLAMLPMLISQAVQAAVSVKRMNKFMSNDELDPFCVTHHHDSSPLVMEAGTFSWGSDEEPILKNINLNIESGALVAIVGPVGSGKSSLLSAFIGEMEKVHGKVNTLGEIAYVPQQAWIQNISLKNNILFGSQLDDEKYEQVLDACALKTDIEILPGGDETEIGEKGINLSGGQKQRVSLARAVYSGADVYLFDDPLSAVDSHVGKHIFDKVISRNGILKGKTRVLVTHNVTYLPEVDHIIVLSNGVISEMGSYKDLLDMKGAFADFLITYLSEAEDEDALQELKEELISKLGPEAERQISSPLKRMSSSTSHISDKSQTEGGRSRSASRQLSVERTDKQNNVNHINGKHEEKGTKLVKAETTETGQVKMRIYIHYFHAIGLLMAGLTLVLNLLSQGCLVGSNMWLSAWSNDKPINGTMQDTELRDLRLGIYGLFGFLQALFVLTGSLALAFGTIQASLLLHTGMLFNILRSPMSFFDTTPLGRIVNRFAKDVDVIDNTLPMTIRSWLNCFLSVIATLVVISISTPIFMSVILPIGILYYFIQKFYVATSRQLKRLESVSRSPIYSHFSESLNGASTIRAYNREKEFIIYSQNTVDENQICYYPSIISNRWLAIRLEIVGSIIVFSASLFAVLGRESLSPGIVGLSVSYALSVTSTLNWMVRMSSELETNIVAVERIQEYTESSQEASWENQENKPAQEWPQNGTVKFDNYATRYREDLELVLRGITCNIDGGERIGIVGRTGAGKSSLTLAIFRIIESAAGKIIIDGVDISTIGLHDLRSHLTIIPQDPVLFSGTLRINLDPFNVHTDEEIWKALEQSHLKAFIQTLPLGILHEIAEGGENLSVGQRQLVCLARALLRKTKVLVLDEATAAVDMETDDLIQATIRKEFSNCTVLTIAHRLNTIMDYNRVMVLDHGKIVEFDSPNNLLQNTNSIFYGMAKDAGLV